MGKPGRVSSLFSLCLIPFFLYLSPLNVCPRGLNRDGKWGEVSSVLQVEFGEIR